MLAVPLKEVPFIVRAVRSFSAVVAYRSATVFVVPPTVSERFVPEEELSAVSRPPLLVPPMVSALLYSMVSSVPLSLGIASYHVPLEGLGNPSTRNTFIAVLV